MRGPFSMSALQGTRNVSNISSSLESKSRIWTWLQVQISKTAELFSGRSAAASQRLQVRIDGCPETQNTATAMSPSKSSEWDLEVPCFEFVDIFDLDVFHVVKRLHIEIRVAVNI